MIFITYREIFLCLYYTSYENSVFVQKLFYDYIIEELIKFCEPRRIFEYDNSFHIRKLEYVCDIIRFIREWNWFSNLEQFNRQLIYRPKWYVEVMSCLQLVIGPRLLWVVVRQQDNANMAYIQETTFWVDIKK